MKLPLCVFVSLFTHSVHTALRLADPCLSDLILLEGGVCCDATLLSAYQVFSPSFPKILYYPILVPFLTHLPILTAIQNEKIIIVVFHWDLLTCSHNPHHYTTSKWYLCFTSHWSRGLGHVHNALDVCCAHKGERGTDVTCPHKRWLGRTENLKSPTLPWPRDKQTLGTSCGLQCWSLFIRLSLTLPLAQVKCYTL